MTLLGGRLNVPDAFSGDCAMSLQILLDLLSEYRPSSALDSHILERVLQFAVAHPIDCCDRSLREGHFTGSAWIIDETEHLILLMHHRKLDRWLQLGGHADGDTNLLCVAVREAREESGLEEITAVYNGPFDLDVHAIPANQNEPVHYHYDVRFLFAADSRQVLHKNEESKNLGWKSLHQIRQLEPQEQSILRLVEKTEKWLLQRDG